MAFFEKKWHLLTVALLARAWIEIFRPMLDSSVASVALLARAWIEIFSGLLEGLQWLGRSPCESVDWNINFWKVSLCTLRRSPCESVDWNFLYVSAERFKFCVALLARAWIEICLMIGRYTWRIVFCFYIRNLIKTKRKWTKINPLVTLQEGFII